MCLCATPGVLTELALRPRPVSSLIPSCLYQLSASPPGGGGLLLSPLAPGQRTFQAGPTVRPRTLVLQTIPTLDCCRLPSLPLPTENQRDPLSLAPREIIYASGSAKSPFPLLLTRTTAPIDSASYARSVREDTAELASYVLSDKKEKRNASFLRRRTSGSSYGDRDTFSAHRAEQHSNSDERIAEVSEPSSPESAIEDIPDDGPSILSSMLKHSPPKTDDVSDSEDDETNGKVQNGKTSSGRRSEGARGSKADVITDGASEQTPLLLGRTISSYSRPPESPSLSDADDLSDVESQKPRMDQSFRGYGGIRQRAKDKVLVVSHFMNPKSWDRHAIWQNVVMAPVHCLPAVVVGLLLNILDALSYGMGTESYMVLLTC